MDPYLTQLEASISDHLESFGAQLNLIKDASVGKTRLAIEEQIQDINVRADQIAQTQENVDAKIRDFFSHAARAQENIDTKINGFLSQAASLDQNIKNSDVALESIRNVEPQLLASVTEISARINRLESSNTSITQPGLVAGPSLAGGWFNGSDPWGLALTQQASAAQPLVTSSAQQAPPAQPPTTHSALPPPSPPTTNQPMAGTNPWGQ